MLALKPFKDFIDNNQLFNSTQRILLAVSGGRDSVLMAHLFHEAGHKFGIAHCNFQLRGKDSEDDETFCEELAASMDVPFYSTRFDTQLKASESKISIQMAARELRYNWFEEIRKDFGYDYISTAHHGGDQVETVLLNLVRGTGLSGLHGILPKREKLIRPLLFLTRKDIDDVMTSENITYRDDVSNASTKYARNRIRHLVLPVLKELNPQLEKTFEINSRHFSAAERFLNNHVKMLRNSLFEREDKKTTISVSELRKLDPLPLLLFELFKPYNFTEAVLDDLIACFNSHPGKIFESSTHRLYLDRNVLYLTEIKEDAGIEQIVTKNISQINWNNVLIQQSEKPFDEVNLNKDARFGYFDADKLAYPLKLRAWKQGDHFVPFGMKGSKKLSDFFISEKIALHEKHLIPVLVNGNNDILWVAGYRSDNRYRLTGETKKVVIFELKKNGE
ncbi:tRNA lysidine(34) synthetase TilS [Pedobacter sp. HMF7647]|uniref:tRNA(Ile)-lysidine synthase n=1 Tax=Hufsiella arboris TaxID=2695275 RepID=A0A7K1YCE8_9SPHI|nr:tRNA lysidine(34) synthetase TilS [Hufsiella arboris]MXV51769.1 tRNA lysidine(34) synthetase TilS [Hufsiella arboris]